MNQCAEDRPPWTPPFITYKTAFPYLVAEPLEALGLVGRLGGERGGKENGGDREAFHGVVQWTRQFYLRMRE